MGVVLRVVLTRQRRHLNTEFFLQLPGMAIHLLDLTIRMAAMVVELSRVEVGGWGCCN